MSNYKSGCDTESEFEFWEESSTHSCKDLVDSVNEIDLHVSNQQNSPCSLLGKGKSQRKKKPSETGSSENNQANISSCNKECVLLEVKKLENTGGFQVEILPETIFHLTYKDHQTSGHPTKAYSSKIFQSWSDRSDRDHFCVHSGIPHLAVTEKFFKRPTVYTGKEADLFNGSHQKQPPDDCSPVLKCNKAVQVSFPCTEAEAGESFQQSTIPNELKQAPAEKLVLFHSIENLCNKKETTARRPLKDYLAYSSEPSFETQTVDHNICSHTSSTGIITSLTLEATYVDPTGLLARNVGSSKARVDKEDSKRHTSVFGFKDPECNQLFKSLRITVLPSSVCLTERQKQFRSFTKQVGLAQIEVNEASQPLVSPTEALESSNSDTQTDQVPSTLKPQSPSQLFASSKHTQTAKCPNFCVRSLLHHKVIPSKVQKHRPEVSRSAKPALLTKNKELQKGQQFRSKPHISAKFCWSKTWDIEPINQNSHKTLEDSRINELYYMPFTHTTTCHCSPLLDWTVDLYSERSYSGTEKLLNVNRKHHKRIGGGKVIPRISSQYLLNPRSSFRSLQYFFPIRKKSNLKMQSILNYCLGWAGGQNKQESCKKEVGPLKDSSNTGGNELSTPLTQTDVRSSTAPLLSSTMNSPIALSTTPPVWQEKKYSPVPCLHNERETASSPAWCPDCKHSAAHGPNFTHIINVVQTPKERNLYNTVYVKELDSEAAQMTCGCLALKKLWTCPCGNMPQLTCGCLALKKLWTCPCGNMPQHGLFPNGDISQSVIKKTRASPARNWKANLAQAKGVNHPRVTFNMGDACCTSCHHPVPMHSVHNVCKQEAARSQFIKAQSYFESGFPMKNVKGDLVEKNRATPTDERKNVKIHLGTYVPQESVPLGAHTPSPSKDNIRVPKYFVYQPKCCSCHPVYVKQHLDTSREVHNGFGSKYKMSENCPSRERVLLAEPGLRVRRQCTCSQELPLFCVDQTDICKGNKVVLSKREESSPIQASPQIHQEWKRLDVNRKCC